MKSRILFVLTLAAFFNPLSVMAIETKIEAKDIACKEWAKGKMLAAQTTSAQPANGAKKIETATSAQ